MSNYYLVSDNCHCEDYPCCGHQRGVAYPMEKRLALELSDRGKINIIREFRNSDFALMDYYDRDY